MKKAFAAAFPLTVPVLAGYLFLGITFGFLMKTGGYPVWYPVFMSLMIYSGALEFAALPLLSAPFDPLGAFIFAFMLSARHLFYGIALLGKYENTGFFKFPLLYLLTDETFSIAVSADAPEGVEKKHFYTAVSLLDYAYWVGGTAVGALFGQLLHFDTTGIDFALTALFIVLFLEQTKHRKSAFSGMIGLVCSAAVLFAFGSEKMVLISMGVILAVLFAAKKGLAS